MCDIIIINRGEKEIDTPRKFEEHFGFAIEDNIEAGTEDFCLCRWDLGEMLKHHNIEYKCFGGTDYNVGELDLIIVDEQNN